MKPLTPADIDWIRSHMHHDPQKLYLQVHGDEHLSHLAMQVHCRAKAKGKLDLDTLGDSFIFPDTLAVEQSTSSALARRHAELVPEGARVIDLTCGLGIDAMAISRRASEVIAIDMRECCTEALRLNATMLELDNLKTVNADCRLWLEEHPEATADLVFIDPARRGDSGQRLYGLADCAPDVLSLLPEIARRSPRLIIKASPMLDIAKVIDAMAPYRVDIIVEGTRTEAKEVLAIVDLRERQTGRDESRITVDTGDRSPFTFTLAQERDAKASFSLPAEGNILYVPGPTISKAAPFTLLCSVLDADAISPSVHLYHSPALPASLPADITAHRVEAVLPFDKKGVKEASRLWPRASVSVRNFPLTAEQLRQRLKVAESPNGAVAIRGVAAEGKRLLIVTTPLREEAQLSTNGL